MESQAIRQSILQILKNQGSQLKKATPAVLAITLTSAALWPALSSGSLDSSLGLAFVSALGTDLVRDFIKEFIQKLGKESDEEKRKHLHDELLRRWHEGGEKGIVFRKEISQLLHLSGAVGFAISDSSGDLKETITQGLASLADQFNEFNWVLDEIKESLGEIQKRQVEQLATQREQLELQREQLAKTNLLLKIQREGKKKEQSENASAKGESTPADIPCPYRGLASFQPEDAEDFFGREELTANLLSRLASSNFLAVIGPSGSGKSSVVRAGVVPAIWNGEIPGSENWKVMLTTPGQNPLEELAVRIALQSGISAGSLLADLKRDAHALALAVKQILVDQPTFSRLVLVVDQFEELFTLCKEPADRGIYVSCLMDALHDKDANIVLVLTLRADFYGRCALYPELATRLSNDQVLVGAMSQTELIRAIAAPAERVGLKLETGLVDMVLKDTAGETGALPMVSHALMETWKLRRGNLLSIQGYTDSGGVDGAIAQTAQKVYASCSPEEQERIRDIFLRLTRLDETNEGRDTRRRTQLHDLASLDDASSTERLLKKLADARLVVLSHNPSSGEGEAEVAHEALIQHWTELRNWLNDDRDNLRLREGISDDAKQWDHFGRDENLLNHRGPRLELALSLRKNERYPLNEIELAYLNACVQVRDREKVLALKRRRMVLIGTSASLLVIMSILIGWSWTSNQNSKQLGYQVATATYAQGFALEQADAANAAKATAIQEANARATAQAQTEQQSKIARAGELAALALSELDNRYDLALLLSVEAFNLENNNRTYGALFSMMDTHSGLKQYLHGHKSEITALAVSPNGNILASASVDNDLILWDVENFDAPIQKALIPGNSKWSAFNIAYSPDSKLLFTSDFISEKINIWDIQDLENPKNISFVKFMSTAMVVSPDGNTLISSDGRGTISVWNIQEPSQPILLSSAKVDNYVYDLVTSPEGMILYGAGYGEITIWDVSDPTQLRLIKSVPIQGRLVTDLEINQTGDFIVSSNMYDKTVMLWRVSPQGELDLLSSFSPHDQDLTDIALSHDSKTLATGSLDESIILWDLSNPNLPIKQKILSGQGLGVTALAFMPDGNRIISGGLDTTLILWDLTKPVPIIHSTIIGHDRGVTNASISPDDRIMVTSDFNNITNVWNISNVSAPEKITTLYEAANPTLSSSGNLLATSSGSDVFLWDMTDPSVPIPLATLYGHSKNITRLTFNPKGDILVSGSSDKTIIIWNISNHNQPVQKTILTGFDYAIFCLSINPQGNILASGSYGKITLWEITDPSVPQKITEIDAHTLPVVSLDFSPDGNILASGARDQTIILWNVSHPEQPLKIATLLRHSSEVESVAFNPKQNILASSSLDGTVILWGIENLDNPSIKANMLGHTDWIYEAIFSNDGKTLVSVSRDETIILWNLDVQSWLQMACQISGRNFTAAEWKQYFPNETYRRTCPNWPAGR